MPHQEIHLTSRSHFEIEAVQRGLLTVDVVGVDTESGMNSQLIGLEETFQGASNRITFLRRTGVGGTIVSIEKGLVNTGNNRWLNIDAVIIEDRQGNQGRATTTGVAIPYPAISQLLEAGPEHTTIGRVLKQLYPHMPDHQDLHAFFTRGQTNRRQLLAQAVRFAQENLDQNT